MATTIKVNGVDRTVDVDGDTPLLVGVARRARHDRHEVRLRHGALRRLHRACRRRRHPLLHHSDRQHRRAPRSPRSRRSARHRRAPRSRRPGSTARSFNAATASRARSCPLRRCSRAIPIRPIPISTTRCPATSAAAGPMSAFAKRSSRPRNRADREADNDPRSHHFPSRRLGSIAISERSLPARFLQAGAAAGGGLMLSLSLPFANGEAEAADRWLRAQRLHPHRTRRADCPDHALCRDGPGHLHLHPDADRRRAGGGPEAGAAGACSAQRKALRQPLAGGVQATGNSNAIRAAWQPLRQAGATARTMLVSAAAKRWNVDPASCRAQSGEVLHAPTGRRIKYGELAADAARMPVPENVALKRPEDFKLIGTPAKRLDTPAKVNGTAVYGIDVRPPGVKIATLAQSPVFGGRVKSVDDAAAKAVKGVRQIVRLDDAVAVVADHMGAAKKGLAALVIEWDDGPHAKLNTEDDRGRARKGDAQFRGRLRRTSAMSTRPWRAPSPRSRRPTRFRSSRTRRWSR